MPIGRPRINLEIAEQIRALWGNRAADDFLDPTWSVGSRINFPGRYERFMPGSRRMVEALLRTHMGGKSTTEVVRIHLLAMIRGYGFPLQWQCGHCRYTSNEPTFFDVDHKVPQSEGGSDDVGNLEIVCPNCHRRKTNRDRVRVKEELLQAQKLYDRNEPDYESDE
jgi:hypothetical protein